MLQQEYNIIIDNSMLFKQQKGKIMKEIRLSDTKLFQGISETEIHLMLDCLKTEEKNYKKDEVILHMGDTVTSLGMVISGSALIENDDIWGNRSILDQIGPGQIFAETYACVSGEKLMVNVTAATDVKVLFFHIERVIETCPQSCKFHSRLIKNLLAIAAQKNLSLSRRIFHTSPKTIRAKLLSYLSDQALIYGNNKFDILFNRQQLADYLGVDRSAMSSALSKMQKDGLIKVRRNHFELLKDGMNYME